MAKFLQGCYFSFAHETTGFEIQTRDVHAHMFFYLTILVAFYMYYFANMVSTILKRYWICLESGLPGRI